MGSELGKMREIKFRAWDKESEEFLLGFYVQSDTGDIFSEDGEGSLCPEDKEIVVEQFTGLHDKNGREIFEGDVCKYWMDDVWKVGFIRWDRGGYEIVVTKMGDRATDTVFEFQGFIPRPGPGETQMGDLFEVIGNIHENPEILK